MGDPPGGKMVEYGFRVDSWKDQPILVSNLDGMMIAFPGETVANLLLLRYEASEREIISAAYDEQDIVIEAGAGIGVTTIDLARQTKQVHAFEPLQDQLEFCQLNLKANHIENVVLYHGVMFWKDGQLEFYRRPEVYGSSFVRFEEEGPLEVSMTSCWKLDRVCQEFNANGVHLDIEGGEADILFNSTLTSVMKLSIEIHPQYIGFERTDEMLRHIMGLGFEIIGGAGTYNYPRHAYTILAVKPDQVNVNAIVERLAPHNRDVSLFAHLMP
jgi:FkbM family methyltransferase